MAMTTVQGSIKGLLWNTYQQKQAPPLSFPFPAPPFGHFLGYLPTCCSQNVFFKTCSVLTSGDFVFLPVLRDPCNAAITKSKETPPLFLFLFPSVLDGYTIVDNKWQY